MQSILSEIWFLRYRQRRVALIVPCSRTAVPDFGAINPGTIDFYTVYAPGLAEPCQPGFPGTVDPEPDPEWCGMSTSALSFHF